MALSLAEQVKQTFNLIALRSEAKARLTGRQWEKRGALVDRCSQEDRFDKAETLDQAQSQVKDAHERRLGRINDCEQRGLSILLSSAERANQLQGKSVQAFDKVADRRRGGERRQIHRHKRDR